MNDVLSVQSVLCSDILLVVMLETTETTGVKQDLNNHNLGITHTVGFITIKSYNSVL